MNADFVASNLVFVIPHATLYHFGILTSTMHNAWVRYTCGRLESRYRYSAAIVYNNFPWSENPTEKQRPAIEAAAQGVLDGRAQLSEASLVVSTTRSPCRRRWSRPTRGSTPPSTPPTAGGASPMTRCASPSLFEMYQRLTSQPPTSPD